MGEPAEAQDFDNGDQPLEPASLRDARLWRTLREIQRLQASLAESLLAETESGSFKQDGHLSAKTWIAALFNCADDEAIDWVRLARAQRDLPTTAAAFREGRIGISQLRAIAKVFRNPRCRQRIADGEPILARHAEQLRYRDFTRVCARFVAVVDPDGTVRDHDAALERRDADEHIIGTEFHAFAHGDVDAGAEMQRIFNDFVDAEYERDLAELRHTLGPDAPLIELARTSKQRRFDALLELHRAGALHTGLGRVEAGDIATVIDIDTFEQHLNSRVTGDSVPVPLTIEELEHRLNNYRCQTNTGVPLNPARVVAAALIGHIRRVVLDSDGIIVDVGRRQRTLRGHARDIALAIGPDCFHPGCDRHPDQGDHIDPHNQGGATSTRNTTAACGPHNRLKHDRGLSIRRDRHGTWHIHRPDTTEITPLHHDPPDG